MREFENLEQKLKVNESKRLFQGVFQVFFERKHFLGLLCRWQRRLVGLKIIKSGLFLCVPTFRKNTLNHSLIPLFFHHGEQYVTIWH